MTNTENHTAWELCEELAVELKACKRRLRLVVAVLVVVLIAWGVA